jgi:DNA replication licensing factor MCM2
MSFADVKHAKMHLRDVVTRDDISEAMRVTIQSFIGAQKISVKKSLSRTFAQYTLPRRVR